MAPTMQGVCSGCKTTSGDIIPPCHWWIGNTILVCKVVEEMWERQWCKKDAFPYTQKGGRLVHTYLGGGRDFNKKDIFVVVTTTIIFAKTTTKLAVCCWVYFDPASHSTTHPSPRPNGSYLWESITKLLLD
eukprot:2503274-Ditylum_brightwellii.AAC.1